MLLEQLRYDAVVEILILKFALISKLLLALIKTVYFHLTLILTHSTNLLQQLGLWCIKDVKSVDLGNC